MGTRSLMARELLLELVGVDIELLYHFVDVVDVILQVVLRIFDSLVPQVAPGVWGMELRRMNIYPNYLRL